MQSYLLAGIDLAWMSNRNPTAIAYGSLIENELTIVGAAQDLLGIGSVIDSIRAYPTLHGIAIDAPLIIKNSTGQRPCESVLGRFYGSKKAACHTSNLNKYPESDGVLLSNHLFHNGFNHIPRKEERWQLECYPHPAIIEIFGLDERHQYKKGSVVSRRRGQAELARMVSKLSTSAILKLNVPSSFSRFLDMDTINTLKGRCLKHNEDVIDAIICLYIAGLFQLGIQDRVFGDISEGYIFVPQRLCI